MKSIKSIVVMLIVGLFFLSGFWSMCFRVNNEIGPIGADKVGRQVLLQSLDHYFDHSIDSTKAGYSIDVESEFSRTPFMIRLAQEPMRTTFLLSYRVKDTSMIDSAFAERLLKADATDFLDLFQGPATIQDDIDIPADSLRSRMAKLSVTTFADFLAAYGFLHFEASVNGHSIVSRDLPQIGRDKKRRKLSPPPPFDDQERRIAAMKSNTYKTSFSTLMLTFTSALRVQRGI